MSSDLAGCPKSVTGFALFSWLMNRIAQGGATTSNQTISGPRMSLFFFVVFFSGDLLYKLHIPVDIKYGYLLWGVRCPFLRRCECSLVDGLYFLGGVER